MNHQELSFLTRQSIVSDAFYFTLHDVGFGLEDVLSGKILKADAKKAYMKEFNNINRACAYAAHHQYLLRFLEETGLFDTSIDISADVNHKVRVIKEFNNIDYSESSMNKYVSKFKNVYLTDNNSRYMSFDHCRKCFIENRKNPSKYDYITLNLYAYLASWGMLRNSFLMQKDYTFNRGIVEILCKDKYDDLLFCNPFTATEKEDDLIIELANEIRNYYIGKSFYTEGLNKKVTIYSVTDTLVTKIILGTFACTVAYDKYVKAGLSKHGMQKTLNKKSLYEIREYAKCNENIINGELANLNNFYTPIKIIDMCLFEKGYELTNE